MAARLTADFSRVARAYRWMEYASFGTALERVRYYRLPEMRQARRALVLGDGDGRFLQQLLRKNPTVEVDAVDCSAGMVRLARTRVAREGGAGLRVQWFEQNALSWEPARTYDLIVTHFFLDCFSTGQVEALVERLLGHLEPGGMWINSDFAIPASGWARYPSLAIVRGLYAAFFLLAGLRTQRLPDDAAAFLNAGLKLRNVRESCAGMLKSERWARS